MPVALAAARRSRRRPTGGWIGAGSSRPGALFRHIWMKDARWRRRLVRTTASTLLALAAVSGARASCMSVTGRSCLRPRRWRRLLRLRSVPSDHAGSGSSRQYRRSSDVRSERRLDHSQLRSNVRQRHRERRRRQLRGLERRRVDGTASPVANRPRRSRHGHDVGSQFLRALRQRRRRDLDAGRAQRHHERREFDWGLCFGRLLDDRGHGRVDRRQRFPIYRR